MKKQLLLVIVFLSVSCLQGMAQAPLKFRDTTISGPQTFAVVMGVSKYKYVQPLNYADKDAELFRNFLRSPGGGNLGDDNIYFLVNEDANETNFQVKFKAWLKAKRLQRGDRLFMYLAGHGDAIDKDQFFYLTSDCNPAGDKNNYLVNGAIRMFDIKTMIAKEVGKGIEVYLIMDACRTNELPGGAEGLGFFSSAVSEHKAGEVMMLAAAAGQESLEHSSIGNGHGLFTWYLVDGLSGVADAGRTDSKVTFAEIKDYVDKNVAAIAQERFKKKQEPYLCCNEFNDKVVSNVDPAYLQKWLKDKSRRGGGNSFNGFTADDYKRFAADTTLVETYNRFNRAIRANNLTGSSSAEDYYQQLEKKFPGNPYTLDAKSSLAAEFINDAQKKVNAYLLCGIVSSSKEKQQNAAAGGLLEKAISLLRADEPEFAAALRGRMYLLKATGDYGTAMDAFSYAHAARRIDPNGAYILNQLSRLHMENNRPDSAAYYADMAAKAAPNWPCALTTLALAKKALDNKNPDVPNPIAKKKPQLCRPSFGFTLGGGINQSNPTYSGNANTGFIGVNSNTAPGGNLGVLYQLCLGNTVSVRPTTTVSFESTDIDFQRRSPTGGPVTIETVSIKSTSVNVALPLIIRFSSKNVAPYLHLGPSFSYMFSQNSSSSEQLPVNKSLFLGNGGIGVDIGLVKSGWVLSPELKYAAGLNDLKDNASGTTYSAALSSLKRNTFSLNVYFRKR